MIVANIANSHNDEYYTPEYAIIPIIKYLRWGGVKRVWCPFDTEQSLFVKTLSRGFEVVHTHISNGEDFFKIERDCDAIVSNPPYSLKTEVFERLFELGKPFAMLVGVVGLFESARKFSLFRDNDFEIMYFNKRISYFKDYDDPKPSINPPFSSVYVCKGILPKQIVFEVIDKSNQPKLFV